MELNPEDLTIESYSHSNGVKIIHEPTGLVACEWIFRGYHKNKAKALETLKRYVEQHYEDKKSTAPPDDIEFLPLETRHGGRTHTSMILTHKPTGVSIEVPIPSGRLENVDSPEGPVAFLRAKAAVHLNQQKEQNMGTPHKHAGLIKAWADGAEIQYQLSDNDWIDCVLPEWHPDVKYRIKPEKVYPKSTLTDDELRHIWENTHTMEVLTRAIADAAVKRYIQEQEVERGDTEKTK